MNNNSLKLLLRRALLFLRPSTRNERPDGNLKKNKITRRVKAAFHFRVFHTHVYARKTLNPSTLYIFYKYIDK